MKLDYTAGFKGLKQIWSSARKMFPKNADNILERYSGKLLDRTCYDWLYYSQNGKYKGIIIEGE